MRKLFPNLDFAAKTFLHLHWHTFRLLHTQTRNYTHTWLIMHSKIHTRGWMRLVRAAAATISVAAILRQFWVILRPVGCPSRCLSQNTSNPQTVLNHSPSNPHLFGIKLWAETLSGKDLKKKYTFNTLSVYRLQCTPNFFPTKWKNTNKMCFERNVTHPLGTNLSKCLNTPPPLLRPSKHEKGGETTIHVI